MRARFGPLVAPLLIIAFAACLAPRVGSAQETPTLPALIDDLNALIEKGERERSADPWFLKDLRDTIARYDNPWRDPLFSEEFQNDGAPSAPWRVVSGEMRVDWRHGLRALVRAPEQATTSPSGSSSQSQDPAAQILGAILQGVIKSQQGDQDTRSQLEPDPSPDSGQAAMALAEAPISNAFKISAEITSRALADGTGPTYALGVYQTAVGDARPGYRLIANHGEGSVTLMRANSRGGTAIVDRGTLPAATQPESSRALVWSRYPDGRMTVMLDGARLIDTADRGFSDPWDGISFSVTGGDVALRRISAMGTAR